MKQFIIFLTILFLGGCSQKNRKPSAVLIGTGKQGQEYFDLLKNDITFKAFVVSPDTMQNNQRHSFLEKAKLAGIRIIVGLDEFKRLVLQNKIDFEIAFITVPHYLHEPFTTPLLEANKIIIKEKPLALHSQKVLVCEKKSKADTPPILTIVQRHFQDSLQEAKKALSAIGKPVAFTYTYSFNLPQVTQGWRADKLKCGGGVVLDMGYHIIDAVNDFFGMPDLNTITAEFAFCYKQMLDEGLEDCAAIDLRYSSDFYGKILLSRHSTRKEEFVIKGDSGMITITPEGYTLCNLNNDCIKTFKTKQTKKQNKLDMLRTYISNRSDEDYIRGEFMRHKNNVLLIDRIYEVAQLNNDIMRNL